jgi:hypothetical protein
MLEIILKKKLWKTIGAIGIAGSIFYGGYLARNYEPQMLETRKRVLNEISENLPKELVPGMDWYKQQLYANPAKYKQDIIDISKFGIKQYPVELFVDGVEGSYRYLKDKVKKGVETIGDK